MHVFCLIIQFYYLPHLILPLTCMHDKEEFIKKQIVNKQLKNIK